MLSIVLLTLRILSTNHYCCYSLVSFVLSAWCHDTWSCLALPIWGWTFSLHDGWAYFRVWWFGGILHLCLFVIAYWGISSFPPSSQSTRPFTGFIHLFDLVVDPYEFHIGAYPPFLASFRIIGPFTRFTIFWPSCRSSWVVILGHIPFF